MGRGPILWLYNMFTASPAVKIHRMFLTYRHSPRRISEHEQSPSFPHSRHTKSLMWFKLPCHHMWDLYYWDINIMSPSLQYAFKLSNKKLIKIVLNQGSCVMKYHHPNTLNSISVAQSTISSIFTQSLEMHLRKLLLLLFSQQLCKSASGLMITAFDHSLACFNLTALMEQIIYFL